MIFYHDLKNKKIAEIHLFYFNCCFYCVLKVGHFKSISLAFFELFDDIFFQGLLGDSILFGFDFICFAVEYCGYSVLFRNLSYFDFYNSVFICFNG